MNKKIVGGLIALETICFSLLLGGIATLGVMVAPVLFKMVTSPDFAGRIFGNILNVWLWPGLASSSILVVSAALVAWRVKPLNRWLLGRLAAAIVMLGFVLAFAWALARTTAIQAGLTKPIEQYPADVNPRLEFDQLHKMSTNLLSVALFAALVWFGLSVVALLKNWPTPVAVVKPVIAETQADEVGRFSLSGRH